MLLKDLGEELTFPNLLKVFVKSSFREVFPQLPVIAIILDKEFCLIISEVFVRKASVFSTFICLFLFLDLSILFTTAKDAPLLKASPINLFPSLFFPLIAKKISFFFISFELIDAFLIFPLKDIFLLYDWFYSWDAFFR